MKIRLLSVMLAVLVALAAAACVSCRTNKGDEGESSDMGQSTSGGAVSSDASSESSSESITPPAATVTEPIIYNGLSGKAHVQVDSINSIFVCTFDESNLVYDIGCEVVIHILTDDAATYRMTTVTLGGYEDQIIDGQNCIGVVFQIDRQWHFEEFPVEITVTFASYRFNFVYAG